MEHPALVNGFLRQEHAGSFLFRLDWCQLVSVVRQEHALFLLGKGDNSLMQSGFCPC